MSSLWLIYCEPQPLDDGNPLALCLDEGFAMNFASKILPVKLQPDIIAPMLAKVRQIADMPDAPERRDGCKDCERLDVLISRTTKGATR